MDLDGHVRQTNPMLTGLINEGQQRDILITLILKIAQGEVVHLYDSFQL